MKNNKKKILIGFIGFAVLVFLIIALFLYLTDKNRLTSEERHYLANNSSTIYNLSILNNVNVFGNEGTGVFYDFIDDFKKEYNVEVNNIAINMGEVSSNLSLTSGNSLQDKENVFYQDHYVLVSKNSEYLGSSNLISGLKIGVLNSNLAYLNEELKDITNLNLIGYDTQDSLMDAFKNGVDIDYMLVPLISNVDIILKDNLNISYHFSDIEYYYKISAGNDSVLASIMQKFYNTWEKDNLKEYFNDYLFKIFINSLNIAQTEVDAMLSEDYKYGFIANQPYEILSSGNYGGVVAQYLKEFSDFSDVIFEFEKYKSVAKMNEALANKKIDLYFGFYNINNGYSDNKSALALNYKVLAHKKKDLLVSNLSALDDLEVYVLKDSMLESYLKTNTKLVVKTYKNTNELKSLIRKKKIIIVDELFYEVNKDKLFENYNVRYSGITNRDYKFKINSDNVFTTLFTKFINITDNHEVLYKGLYNYEKTLSSGTITGTIARYFMYIIVAALIIFVYVYHISKKVKMSKKIKKEDKLKYIDQLTSLKNRNYLSENLDNWGKNTIYPQAVIVIDLNNVQYINDTMGYEKGDSQIKAAANILVKNQLDNSDIMRTDGNEFVIYLVGYQTKQITSYIHKLNKEFKNLPYEYGAAIGYSMITDDIKSIEDAMNEAVEDVKKQKSSKKEE